MVGTSNESVPEMASDPSIFEHHFEYEQVLKKPPAKWNTLCPMARLIPTLQHTPTWEVRTGLPYLQLKLFEVFYNMGPGR